MLSVALSWHTNYYMGRCAKYKIQFHHVMVGMLERQQPILGLFTLFEELSLFPCGDQVIANTQFPDLVERGDILLFMIIPLLLLFLELNCCFEEQDELGLHCLSIKLWL